MSRLAVGGRNRSLRCAEPNRAMTGPTMLALNASGSGTQANRISSDQIWRCRGVQSWPPHSTGQLGTATPRSFMIRCAVTTSSGYRGSPSRTRWRTSAGIAVVKKLRSSSRNAASSSLNANFTVEPPIHLPRPDGRYREYPIPVKLPRGGPRARSGRGQPAVARSALPATVRGDNLNSNFDPGGVMSLRTMAVPLAVVALTLAGCGAKTEVTPTPTATGPCEIVSAGPDSSPGEAADAGDPSGPEVATGYRTDMTAVRTARYGVVTANPLATRAACDVLRDGG